MIVQWTLENEFPITINTDLVAYKFKVQPNQCF